MNDASILENCRIAMAEAALLERQVDHLEALLGPAGLISAGCGDRRRTNMREAAIEQQLSHYVKELEERRQALSGELARAELVLAHVRCHRSAVVLRGLYLSGESVSVLAELLNLSARQVYRIRDAALTTLRQRHTCGEGNPSSAG